MLYKELLKIKEKIIFDYEILKMSASRISEKYCKTKKRFDIILRILKENNIRIRDFTEIRPGNKLNINIDYFKTINTNEKAYWLGFLYADGSIIYDKKRGYASKIVLALKDEKPIRDFQKAVSSTHKICKYNIFDKRTKKYYIRNSISITSKFFAENVINQGLKGKNFYGTNFPNIEEKFYSHFIRGLFDGDGCLWTSANQTRINFLGTENIIAKIKEILINKFKVSNNKLCFKHENDTGKLTFLNFNSYNDVLNCLNYIYQDSTPETRLERKYDKYINFINTKKTLRPRTGGKKKIIQLDLNNNFIKEWESITSAGKFLNICYVTISLCCRGFVKSAGGFKWEYAKKT